MYIAGMPKKNQALDFEALLSGFSPVQIRAGDIE